MMITVPVLANEVEGWLKVQSRAAESCLYGCEVT